MSSQRRWPKKRECAWLFCGSHARARCTHSLQDFERCNRMSQSGQGGKMGTLLPTTKGYIRVEDSSMSQCTQSCPQHTGTSEQACRLHHTWCSHRMAVLVRHSHHLRLRPRLSDRHVHPQPSLRPGAGTLATRHLGAPYLLPLPSRPKPGLREKQRDDVEISLRCSLRHHRWPWRWQSLRADALALTRAVGVGLSGAAPRPSSGGHSGGRRQPQRIHHRQ